MSSDVESLIRREVERRTAMVRPYWSIELLRQRKGRLRLLRRLQVAVLVVATVAGTAGGAFAMTKVFTRKTAQQPLATGSIPEARRGRVVFVSDRSGNDEIYSMNLDGTDVVRLTDDPADDRYPAWSPDGTKIAFGSYTEETEGDIYVMNEDGSGLTALTSGAAADKDPAWSPDGAKIAFARDYQIYVMNADGSGLVKLTSLRNGVDRPAWSPDGTKMAFNGVGGRGSLYVMNADGSGLTRIFREYTQETEDYTSRGAWSPDGSWILFTRIASVGPCSQLNIYRIHPDGSGLSAVTNDGRSYTDTWSPDGSRIMFDGILGDSCLNELFIMNADGTGRVRLTSGPANNFNGDWRPASH